MENLPVEILEIIFGNIASLKDIQSCFNTCTSWKQIIENMFSNKGDDFQILILVPKHYLA